MEKNKGVEVVLAKTRLQWRRWLQKNSQKRTEVCVVIFNKKSKIRAMAHSDAVEEALCFGWIDSLANRRDETSFYQRFSPRKPKSNWSKPNIERVEKMIKAGFMTEHGQRAIDLAKQTGKMGPVISASHNPKLTWYIIRPIHRVNQICLMAEIEIEAYTDNFKPDVVDLILTIQQDEFNIPIDRKGQPDLENIPEFYQVNKGNFWLAKVDGKVAGTIALLDIGNGSGALRKMFVNKDYRGKAFGVGQRLLDTLLDWAKQKHYNKIYLGTTEKFVAAQRFYEKNNFSAIDKSLLPKDFPLMTVDVKFYCYRIDSF